VLEKPARYATDKAGVMPAERLSALNEALARFERETSNQVVVYVDRRLPADCSIEELAAATFRSWAIGQKDRSNGVLFLVFVDDRAMRVEVGYGLEGVIPDAIGKRITSDVVKPFFKKGDYAGGIEAGARALVSAARGEGYAGTGRTAAETIAPLPPWTLGTTFVAGFVAFLIGLVRRRKTGERVLGVLAMACSAASIAAFAGAALTGHPSLWILGGGLLAATVVLALINSIVGAAPSGSSRRSSSSGEGGGGSSSTDSSSSSGDSSSDSSSSSPSDFSGGGGDSGGGGSSDNW
jgi:uncharacterized protein